MQIVAQEQGRRHGGTVPPPLLTKVIFVNRLEPMRKNWGYVGGLTSPTILKFQPEFVTSGFQRPDLTYILSNLFLLLMYWIYFFVFWNSCAIPLVLCVIKL